MWTPDALTHEEKDKQTELWRSKLGANERREESLIRLVEEEGKHNVWRRHDADMAIVIEIKDGSYDRKRAGERMRQGMVAGMERFQMSEARREALEKRTKLRNQRRELFRLSAREDQEYVASQLEYLDTQLSQVEAELNDINARIEEETPRWTAVMVLAERITKFVTTLEEQARMGVGRTRTRRSDAQTETAQRSPFRVSNDVDKWLAREV